MRPVPDLYPSRTGDDEKILQRLDPVVYGRDKHDLPHALTASQLDCYEQNGYLVIPDFMPEMVEPVLQEVQRLKRSVQGREELVTEPDSGAVRTIFRPFAFSQLIDRLARHPAIVNKVKQMLGSEIYLMQSRINIKPAFKGKSFAWHSDFETWHVEDGMPSMRAVTAWLMLSDSHPYNGPLYVIPGSHMEYVSCAGITLNDNYRTSLKQQKLGVPRPQTMEKMLQGRKIEGVYGKAGTLVFHECNLMHGSPDNISGDDRSLLMFVYNSCENKPVAPFSGQPGRPDFLSNPDQAPLMVACELGGAGREWFTDIPR